MQGRRLPDQTMPAEPGDFALWRDQPRPPYGVRDEWFVMCPQGTLGALIPEKHQVIENDDGTITVSPSIVMPTGSFHGFLRDGVWT